MVSLNVGDVVTIKVINPLYHTRDRSADGVVGPQFIEYTGTVIKQKWFKPNEIGLTTNDVLFPFRVLNIDRIVEVGGNKVDYSTTKSDTVTKTVQGSKGETYIVTKNGNNVHCTCNGYRFRNTCKHVKEI